MSSRAEPCAACPCPDICLRRESFCGWMQSDPANATKRQHICYRSRVASEPAPLAPYPPILTQAGNALAAAGRFVSSGCATVDRAEFDRRRSICAGCEHFDAARDRCRKCGCALAVKPWSKAEKCPEGKW